MLDIVDESGNPTGRIKERSKVHEDGDMHRTSHVWIVRDNDKSGMDILLQKRSHDKDCFPGCYDVSSAGHIPAGDEFMESAIRELKEELGIEAVPDELEDLGIIVREFHEVFYGKMFNDNQVSKVYKMKKNNLDIDELNLQKEEIECAMWIDFDECIKAIRNNTLKHCLHIDELEMLRK